MAAKVALRAPSDTEMLTFVLARMGISRAQAVDAYHAEGGGAEEVRSTYEEVGGEYERDRSDSHDDSLLAHAKLLQQAAGGMEAAEAEAVAASAAAAVAAAREDDDEIAKQEQEQEDLLSRVRDLIASVDHD